MILLCPGISGLPPAKALAQALDQTTEALARQVFGQPRTLGVRPFTLPLRINGSPRGDFDVLLPAGDEPLKVRAAPLLDALEGLLRPAMLDALRPKADANGYLALPAIEEAGLRAVFDRQLLEIRIDLPPEARRIREIDIRGRGTAPPARGAAIKPADFSGYLNIRSGVELVERAAEGADSGRQPMRLDLDGAINVHQFVFEGAGSWTEEADTPWQRGDFRLLRDWPEDILRLSFGDQRIDADGFQAGDNLLGFKIERNFALQPYRITQPINETRFSLQNPATVDVIVNGRTRRTLELPAGTFDIRDFPLVTGLNDVRLRILDDVGRVEMLNFDLFFDNELLADGEQEYSYVAGLPEKDSNGLKSYRTDIPTISAFHRVGLSETLTVGGNFQSDDDGQLLGGSALWATGLGNFLVDMAGSRIDDAGAGFRARVEQRLTDLRPSGNAFRVFSASAEYISRDFGAIGTQDPANAVAARFAARYSQDLFWELSGGLGGSVDLGRDGNGDAWTVNANLTARLASGLTLTANIDRIKRADGEKTFGAFLTLTFTPRGSRHTFVASEDTVNRRSRLDWSFTPPTNINNITSNVAVQRSQRSHDVTANLSSRTNRLELGFTQNLDIPREGEGGRVTTRSNLTLGTSLAFAGGHFAVGRPISNSFALVTPHPALEGRTIGVDPLADTFTARADFLGPAVVPQLEAYFRRNIAIEAPELPAGYDLGKTLFSLVPTNRSGTVVEVGTDAVVLLGGVIEDRNGEPIALQAGRIRSLDEPDREPVMMFTNRTGRFRSSGFKPGRYEFELLAHPGVTETIVIPENATGLYDVETIRLEVDASPSRR